MGAARDGRTADRILDVAERLVQVRGYNAFSYADVADALGIQKASLHHHYSTKAELGVALVDRYRGTFSAALDAIRAGRAGALRQFEQYVELYRAVLKRGRMCMCGMLAADFETLPKSMRSGISRFFADNEAWLTALLDQGRADGAIGFEGASGPLARLIISSLEGAMLVSRASGSPRHFDDVAGQLQDSMRPPVGPKRRRPGSKAGPG